MTFYKKLASFINRGVFVLFLKSEEIFPVLKDFNGLLNDLTIPNGKQKIFLACLSKLLIVDESGIIRSYEKDPGIH